VFFLRVCFNPEKDLPPFTVILVPYTFENATLRNIFVVLCHEGGHAFCIKTTTNSTFYKNSPGRLAGCVPYKKGELFFREDTIIQPDNQFPISHEALIEAERLKALEILGIMPEDFREKLIKAVNSSPVMDSRKKERVLKTIPK
jgi:hypothetical protein